MGRLAAVLGSLALGVLIVLAYLFYNAPPALRLRAGQAMPDLELPDFTGKGGLRLSSLHAQPVVLAVFDMAWPATPPYLRDLERLRALYQDRGLIVVGISVDPIDDSVDAVYRLQPINFYLLRDAGALALRPVLGAPTEPTPDTYLIAPGGRVAAAYAEPVNWRDPAARRPLEAILPPPRAVGLGSPR
jgi:peroxiredoxin